MRWAAGLMAIATGMLLVLPSLAFFVAQSVYVTLGTSFPPGWFAVAATAGAALVGGGFWILRSR